MSPKQRKALIVGTALAALVAIVEGAAAQDEPLNDKLDSMRGVIRLSADIAPYIAMGLPVPDPGTTPDNPEPGTLGDNPTLNPK